VEHPKGRQAWSFADVRALGATTDVVTAGQVLGLSRNTAYRLVRRGAFPVPVIKAGARYRVPVAGLLAALHLNPAADTTHGGGHRDPPKP
jgi:hypothetical protein